MEALLFIMTLHYTATAVCWGAYR